MAPKVQAALPQTFLCLPQGESCQLWVLTHRRLRLSMLASPAGAQTGLLAAWGACKPGGQLALTAGKRGRRPVGDEVG